MSIWQGLCAYGGYLWAAWKGEAGDDQIFCSQFDGIKWSPKKAVGGGTSVGPALSGSGIGASMIAAWKGAGNDQQLWYASFDGWNWSPQAVIPGTGSSIGPSLCEFQGKLYAAWKGAGNDQQLRYASFDGWNWSPQAAMPGTTGQDS